MVFIYLIAAFILTALGGFYEGARLLIKLHQKQSQLVKPVTVSVLYVGIKALCYLVVSIFAIYTLFGSGQGLAKHTRFYLLYIKGNEKWLWWCLISLVLMPFYIGKYFFFRRKAMLNWGTALVEIPYVSFLVYLPMDLFK